MNPESTKTNPSSQTVTILKSQLERWYELLGISGNNTKQTVRNDIKSILGGK